MRRPIGGLAFLGAIAGSLASFLRVGGEPDEADGEDDLVREIRALREQVHRLEGSPGPDAPDLDDG